MIGLALVCHGKMAEGMKDSINLIIGEQQNFVHLGLHEGMDIQEFSGDVYTAIASVNDGDGVIVLVDMLNASPYNIVSMNITKLLENNIQIRLVSGVNLPMLIETLMQREVEKDLSKLYKIALQAGISGIKELFEEFESKVV